MPRKSSRIPAAIRHVLGVATGLACIGVHAQEARQSAALEEITVTARKFDERLLDAPIAVSAYTSETLEDAGIRDIVDIARMTPGFAMQDASRTNDTPFIRGMSVNSAFRDQQHASSFIDGVFVQGLARTLDFNTEIERIEVIRGPQSALFGRATFAGAINYITKKPSNEFEGKAVASLGENGLRDLSLNLSGPIVSDKLQFRVNGQLHEYGGQWENGLDGRSIGGEQTNSGAISLRFTPTDNVEVLLRSSLAKFDDEHPPTLTLGSSVNNCNLGGTRAFLCGDVPVPSGISLNLDKVQGGYRRTDQQRNYLTINWAIGEYELASTTSYNDEKFSYYVDGDGTPLQSGGGIYQALFVEKFRDTSQDLRLSSGSDGPFRWLAGLYWFEGEYGISQEKPTSSPANPRSAVNKSMYASLSWTFIPSMTVSIDGRYQEDQIYVTSAATGLRTNDQTNNSFLPRVILDWKPVDWQTYYASVSKGNRPASFNTVNGTPPDLVNIAEQELWSYELGAKFELLDGKLALSTALYHIDWDNQTTQQQIIVTINGVTRPIFINANVGRTQIRGAEFEATYRPLDQLELRAALSLNQAEYQKFLSDVCNNVLGNRTCPSGARLQNTPETTGALAASWRQPVGSAGWQWVTRADLTYRERMPVSEVNTATNPSMTLVNLRTGIDTDRWTATLWANNLTDEDSPAFATRFTDLNAPGFPYGYQVTLRRGTEFGMTATYRF